MLQTKQYRNTASWHLPVHGSYFLTASFVQSAGQSCVMRSAYKSGIKRLSGFVWQG